VVEQEYIPGFNPRETNGKNCMMMKFIKNVQKFVFLLNTNRLFPQTILHYDNYYIAVAYIRYYK
jgi:hypothetical protein